MTELSRSLLAAAREGLGPDAAAMARVRAKVAASVGAPAVDTSAVVSPAGSSGLLLKLGALLLAIGVVATAVVVVRSSSGPAAPQFAVGPSEADEVRPDDDVAALDVSPAARTRAVPAARDSDVPAAVPAESAAVRRADVPAETFEPATLSREVELIDLAMVSLRKSAPKAAIEAIRVFDRETRGQGQMAEEAAAIEIEARCRLHEDVTDRLAVFDRRWPSSAQRVRIQTACFAR